MGGTGLWQSTSWPLTQAPPATAASSLTGRAISAPRPRRSSPRFSPGRAGWSTTPGRSGPPSWGWRRRPWARSGPRPPTWPPSASPTSGRPPSSGTGPPGSRCATPLCGSAGAPAPTATRSRRAPRTCASGPDWWRTPISPGPRSSGSWTTCPGPGSGRGSSSSAPWRRG